MTKGNAGGRRRMGGGMRKPYPFVYSRDLWDARRFSPLGTDPGSGPPSRWGTRFAVATLVVVLGGSLLLLIVQFVQWLIR